MPGDTPEGNDINLLSLWNALFKNKPEKSTWVLNRHISKASDWS
jgi:hypothetical protein